MNYFNYLEYSSLTGCCKVIEISCFGKSARRKRLKDNEWLDVLTPRYFFDGFGFTRLIVFSHSTKENGGAFSPKNFAEWLRSKGQDVAEVTYEHVTLYSCSLSDEFWKELEDYKKLKEEKEQKENEQYDRGFRTT